MPRFAEFTYPAAMPQIGRSPGSRPNSRLAPTHPNPTTATVLTPKASSERPANPDSGIRDRARNRAAGIARWNTNRPSTDAAASPSRPQRQAA